MFIGAGPARLVKEEDVAARVLVLAPARRQRRRQCLRSSEAQSHQSAALRCYHSMRP
jgi:hypothetical protein